jgi:ABC-2 type transport system permease protein
MMSLQTLTEGFAPGGPRRREYRQLRADFGQGLRMGELWLFLGWREVQKHYRRSILGPFWLTLSLGVTVAGLGLLYSQIFGLPVRDYLPFLATGFIVWGLIAGSLNGACTVFIEAAAAIRQVPLPLSVHVFRFVWTQLINFGHNFLIYFLVIAFFAINPGPVVLLAVPGLALMTLNVVWVVMILGPVSARFRDIPMIIGSVVQLAFFLTPILWSAEQIPERATVVGINPFYHFLEITRNPLLGEPPGAVSWTVCSLVTLVLGAVAVSFFARYRARIAYWV